jgi:hypothetical protein
MRFAGERGQGSGDLLDAGADVDGGGPGVAAAVVVVDVGAGDGVAEVPLKPVESIVPTLSNGLGVCGSGWGIRQGW